MHNPATPPLIELCRGKRFAACCCCLLWLAASQMGCCYCGTAFYDDRAYDTWEKLKVALHDEPVSVDKKETGVSIQLPILFGSPKDPTPAVPLRRGEGEDYRVFPPSLNLTNLRFAYEMRYEQADGQTAPIYCYLAVDQAKPLSEKRDELKASILQQLKAKYPNAAWETKKLGEDGPTALYLSVTGEQTFAKELPKQKFEAQGRLDLYLVTTNFANVIVGWRGPVALAKSLHFFEAAEHAMTTLKSEPPEAPKPPPADDGDQPSQGTRVQIPGTDVTIIPPPGFQLAKGFPGFTKQGSAAAIAVQQQSHPYQAVVPNYGDVNLQKANFTVHSREDVTLPGGKPGLLLLLEKDGRTYWNLLFGTDRKTFIVTGTIADPSDDAEKAELKQAVLSAQQ